MYSSLSNTSLLPYTVIFVTDEVIELIALPNSTLPVGTTFIGNSLLGESILILAVTLFGTVSTLTILPFESYATNLTSSTVVTPVF